MYLQESKSRKFHRLDATGSTDPDGNNLIYRWSVYSEPGSYQGDVKIEGNNAEKCKVHIPSNTAGKNIHIILELTDEATPALTVYRRVVLKLVRDCFGTLRNRAASTCFCQWYMWQQCVPRLYIRFRPPGRRVPWQAVGTSTGSLCGS